VYVFVAFLILGLMFNLYVFFCVTQECRRSHPQAIRVAKTAGTGDVIRIVHDGLDGVVPMADLLFVVITICVFALMVLYVRACEKLR
jgi:hypothetical protein